MAKPKPSSVKRFTSPRWMLVMVIGAALLFTAGLAFSVMREGWWHWMSLSFLVMALMGMGGILETLVQSVVLDDTHIHVTTLRGRRSYARETVKKVHQAKGVPDLLELTDGAVVKLPGVGSYLPNSIRAWLKRGAEPQPPR